MEREQCGELMDLEWAAISSTYTRHAPISQMTEIRVEKSKAAHRGECELMQSTTS